MPNLQKQWAILKHLLPHKNGWTAPTGIGMAFGYSYEKASGWASPTLRRMVEKGWVERSRGGKYRITEAGFQALPDYLKPHGRKHL